MSDGEVVNEGRRRFLTAATSVVGAVGAVGVAVPFVGSWNPSAKAKAAGAPVKVNLAKIAEGQMVTEEWRGKPVWVVKRTQTLLDGLEAVQNELQQLRDAGMMTDYSRFFKSCCFLKIGIISFQRKQEPT